MIQKGNRPPYITIIAILAIISGILLLIGEVGLIGAGALFSIASTNVSNNPNGSQSFGPFFWNSVSWIRGSSSNNRHRIFNNVLSDFKR